MELSVAVGSLNPVKVNAVARAFKLFFGEVKVLPVKVDSGVPPQPIGLQEIVDGAINRARRAQAATGADYGVGIEAGLIEFPGTLTGYIDLQVCAIVDREGRITIGHGPGFEYPPAVVREVLEAGHEVGEVMERLTGIRDIKRRMGAIGYLSKGVIDRTRLCELAVLMALIPRINPELYGLAREA